MPRPSSAREDILEAALSLFWRNSYEAIGVDTICKQAGVKKGSFYHFFPSKEDVALNLLETIHLTVYKDLLQKAFAADVGPYERFCRFLASLERYAVESLDYPESEGRFPGCPVGNLVLELSTQSERLRRKLDQIIDTHIETFSIALEEAQQAGSLPSMTDHRQQAELIAAAWQGGILLAKAHNDPCLCVRIFRQAIDCTFSESLARRA